MTVFAGPEIGLSSAGVALGHASANNVYSEVMWDISGQRSEDHGELWQVPVPCQGPWEPTAGERLPALASEGPQ